MFEQVRQFFETNNSYIVMALVVVVMLLVLSKLMGREGMTDMTHFKSEDPYNQRLRHHTTTESAHGACQCTPSLADQMASVSDWDTNTLDQYETRVLMESQGTDGDLFSNHDNRARVSPASSEDLLATHLHNSPVV